MNYLIKISKRVLDYKSRWKNQQNQKEVIRTSFNMDLYLDYLHIVNSQTTK